MAVLTFDPSQGNCLEVDGGKSWFLAETGDGSAHLLPTLCPHRGGPLHLGTLDAQGEAVRCPWHDNPVKVRWLQKQALPLIRRRNGLWTAIVPDSAGTPRTVRRTVLVGPLDTPAVRCGGQSVCLGNHLNQLASKE